MYIRQPYEMFVTSSGTTTEFETYEFDVFTWRLVVAGYVTGNESISISEVSVITHLKATALYILPLSRTYCLIGCT